MGSRIGFGMQCFWGAEAIFGSLDGVYTTRVGYAGGSTPTPTYKNLADHIETVEVVFDESRLTLNSLLDTFFKSHDPTTKYKRQYISAIFYYDEEQRKTINNWIEQHSFNFSKPIVTEIIKNEHFHNAENYHQKYHLRKHNDILSELKLNDEQIITSSIATRLNAFCAGFGSLKQLKEGNFNISTKSKKELLTLICEGPNLSECGI